MVAADRHVSNPDASTVGHQQRGVVGTHVDNDCVIVTVSWIAAVFAVPVNVVAKEVVQSKRCGLDNFNFLTRIHERLHLSQNLIAFHGEQADFRFQHEATLFDTTAQRLVVPNHVIQIEWNLLPRFVLNNLSNLAGFDRWQLDELRKRCLTGNRDDNLVTLQRIARTKRLQRSGDKFFRNRVRLTQNFRMRNVVKRNRYGLLGSFGIAKLNRFQPRLTNINAPRSLSLFSHA